jgi:hypothetical protein
MTQNMANQFDTPEKQSSLPPSYADSSPATHIMNDYIHEQLGGGRRHQSPPVELTPTRLRSNIKTTSRDVGIVKEAAIRRQVYQFPSPPTQSTHLNATALTSLADGGAARSNASSLTLPHPNSRNPSPLPGDGTASSDTSSRLVPLQHSHHPSPFLGEPASRHPAPIEDIFYGTMDTQPAWMSQDSPNAFDYMVEGSFTASLLSDQVQGTTADCHNESLWAATSLSEGHTLKVPNSPSSSHNRNMSGGLTPPLNVIPPTPLKDTSAPRVEHVFAEASSLQLDLSLYPSDNPTQVRFPEENAIDHGPVESTLQEQSLTGRRSSETNLMLEDGFAAIERSFLELSKSTTSSGKRVFAILAFIAISAIMTVMTVMTRINWINCYNISK